MNLKKNKMTYDWEERLKKNSKKIEEYFKILYRKKKIKQIKQNIHVQNKI